MFYSVYVCVKYMSVYVISTYVFTGTEQTVKYHSIPPDGGSAAILLFVNHQ